MQLNIVIVKIIFVSMQVKLKFEKWKQIMRISAKKYPANNLSCSERRMLRYVQRTAKAREADLQR